MEPPSWSGSLESPNSSEFGPCCGAMEDRNKADLPKCKASCKPLCGTVPISESERKREQTIQLDKSATIELWVRTRLGLPGKMRQSTSIVLIVAESEGYSQLLQYHHRTFAAGGCFVDISSQVTPSAIMGDTKQWYRNMILLLPQR